MKVSLPKISQPKLVASPLPDPPLQEPIKADPAPIAAEILESKVQDDPDIGTLSIPSLAQKTKLNISLPKNYLHRYFCKVCGSPIDVPHSDYLALKESTSNGERLQCKKHGGYARLLSLREKISA